MNQEPAIRTLALTGVRTLRQAAQTYAEFVSALQVPGDLWVNCEDVSEADLSLVQIIIAAQRDAASRGCRLVMSQHPSGALLDVLRRGGFAAANADPASWAAGSAVA
jgi:anti-anti-sigma regulatory factor